jgi:hypothetical protein
VEGNGFEISVPRCLATANSVGAFISAGERRLLEPQKQLYRFTEPTTARAIPPRRLSIGSNPTEASKPLPIWRGTGFSNPFPSSSESCANPDLGRFV